MTLSAMSGPIVVYGQNPAATSGYQPDYNGDTAPSAFAVGTMLLDPRFGYRGDLQPGSLAAFGLYISSSHLMIDQAPAAANAANIAAAQNVTAGTAMTLAGASTGITIAAAAVTLYPSGRVVPAGTLFIDGAPTQVFYGQNKAVAGPDPRSMISRCVQITGVTSGAGGQIAVRGLDIWGYPVTELITVAAGANTVTGKKGFDVILSATPAFTDAHNYSVGTADVFELPLASSSFAHVNLTWNNAPVTATTGYTAADTTSPATGTTGSVRGTYAVQSASDGTKRLQVYQRVVPWGSTTALVFGVSQYAS